MAKYLPDNRNPVQLTPPNVANQWQATFGLPGMGGVYQPLNLGLYSYGHLNPVRYSDPDGRIACAGACVAAAVVGIARVGVWAWRAWKAYRVGIVGGTATGTAAGVILNESNEGDTKAGAGSSSQGKSTGAKDAPLVDNPAPSDEWIYDPKDDPKVNPDGSTKPNTWTTPDDFPTAGEATDKLDPFKPVEGRRPARIPEGVQVGRGKTPGGEGPYGGSGGANETVVPGGLPPGSVGPWEPLP